MEELNVDKYLILKKPEEEGPEIRGGTVDALIIQATKTARNGGKIETLCYTLQEMRIIIFLFYVTFSLFFCNPSALFKC